MKITLRKANAVQNSITEAIKAIKITGEAKLNEFQEPTAELQKANSELFANDARRQKLLLSFYNIRGLVGQANASAGVDLALAKAAYIDKRIGQLNEIAGFDVVTDLAVINGKIEKLKTGKDETRRLYGYESTVDTGVISTEQLAQVKTEIKNLKKQKQGLNDEILELNIKTEIPLSDEVVATLQAEGLI
jgi:uncharacterized protein YdcH (DUF465 family)